MEYKNTGYFISKDGVITNKHGRIMKQYKNEKFKYYCVGLKTNKKQKTVYVHRMVAETYVPNPEKKEFINHKDGNKFNNNAENLEWVTRAENVQHSYDLGLKVYKPLHYKGKFGSEHNRSIKITCDGIIYNGLSEASRLTGIPIGTIHYSLKNNKALKTGKHFQFIKP